MRAAEPLSLLGGAALCWLAVACQSPRPGPPRATDRYEGCEDPAGRAALAAARAAIARGAVGEALPDLRRAIEACPDNVRSHLLYLDTALEVGGAAQIEMEQFYAGRDDGVSPVWPYAQARLAADHETRQLRLQEAVRRDRTFYWGYLSLGRMWHSIGNTENAAARLRDALSARPDCPEARLALGQVLSELGRYEEAEVEYGNYVRARPTDREVLREYVRLLIYQLARLDQASPLVQRMVDQDPEDIEALMNLAAIHWKAGKPHDARDVYRQVLQIDPNSAAAVLNLANLYYEPLARDDKQAAWTRARRAYRYYLRLGRTDTVFDVWDQQFAVPDRLARIESELGPDEAAPPRLGEF
ncbi:MAG: tetratricopeptide repeat protein [Planctomycetota bacterium]